MVTAQLKPPKPQIELLPELPVLRFPKDCPLTDELLLQISSLNRAWRFERTSEGALLMNFPAGTESSATETLMGAQTTAWWETHLDDLTYNASLGVRRPDGSVRAPDVAWVSSERLGQRTRAERRGLMTTIPDFVVEVRSPSNSLKQQQEKMEEWISFGVRLGMLVDPDDRLVFVYRPGREPERYERPAQLSAEPEMPGFTIDFEKIWAVIGEDD